MLTTKENNKEQMNVVVVGHVDHGKSTLLGRLFADTGSLPEGKLEFVREQCKRNSKTFEYAFLLDTLKDEQAQGITIDSARAFFKTQKRDYIIIDAPGHIEFLKNMISGAARAEAAILLIDANEGIMENSRRHAYMLAMLGIKQVVVCVNKMDLVSYDKTVFEQIKTEFTTFLESINIIPKEFIAISARDGDNIANVSENMNWFNEKTILSIFDDFEKEIAPEHKPFRMHVQDIYKFTNFEDDRRIVAGRIAAGTIHVDDAIVFLPSNKRSIITSIEEFNDVEKEKKKASAEECVGFTLKEQIYINRGEMMCIDNGELPIVSSTFSANIFWMGNKPLSTKQDYILKIGSKKVKAKIKKIKTVLDSSKLEQVEELQVSKNNVAECVIECSCPIAFDTYEQFNKTGRFVIVDGYDIAGGGIITTVENNAEIEAIEHVFTREKKWDRSFIKPKSREIRYAQKPTVILLTGPTGYDKKTLAKRCEEFLFRTGRIAYFLGIGNILRGLDSDVDSEKRKEHIRRFAEVCHILYDSGQIVLATASDFTIEEIKLFKTLVNNESVLTISLDNNKSTNADLQLIETNVKTNVMKIIKLLKKRKIIFG